MTLPYEVPGKGSAPPLAMHDGAGNDWFVGEGHIRAHRQCCWLGLDGPVVSWGAMMLLHECVNSAVEGLQLRFTVHGLPRSVCRSFS